MKKCFVAFAALALCSSVTFAEDPTVPEVPEEVVPLEAHLSQQQTAEGGDAASLAVIEEGALEVDQTINVDAPDVTNTTVVDARDQSSPTTHHHIDARTINQTRKPVVHSAAPSFSSICTSGAAAQRPSYGVSLGVTSDVCTALQLADAYNALGDQEEALRWVEVAAAHAKVKGRVGYLRHILTLGIL